MRALEGQDVAVDDVNRVHTIAGLFGYQRPSGERMMKLAEEGGGQAGYV